MKIFGKILIWVVLLAPLPLWAQEHVAIGVAPFQVQGPAEWGYLGGAAQDAVIGSLLQKGYAARAYPKDLDPDKLTQVKKGKDEPGLLVAGRISVVGKAFRVRVKWVDRNGVAGEEYLQASQVEDLLPQLEAFAAQRLQPPPAAVAVPADVKKKEKEEEPVKPPVEPAEKVAAPAPPPPQVPEKKEEEKQVAAPEKPRTAKDKAAPPVELRDYRYISQRLPFEVRGLAYGDVDGNGEQEVLLTSQHKLYLYRFQGEQLELMAEYAGKKLDYFVKVAILPAEAGKAPYVALTNLRGDQASSKILQFSGGQFVPVVENIPYQLRVLKQGDEFQLVGAPYHATTPAWHDIYRLAFSGHEVKPAQKLDLPMQTHLYNYHWMREPGTDASNLVVMTPLGKLHLYKQKESKLKKIGTSRESYGGSGNYIPVEVKDFFNEVVQDYYAMPPGVQAVEHGGDEEVIVVKNESMVKNVIGRVPIISDGRLFCLKFDAMGFVETWESKRIDGSIQDYQVTMSDGRRQLLAAVRLRDPGLLGEVGRNDSVLLVYDLD
jgi:hypothetical protein